ncbi:MAG: cob(I)alamin adenosyltransferase [Candidatus Petromonas sp.]|nr:cob(I)alamin adenosyltransferase [Candidatus Petromonas sp.]
MERGYIHVYTGNGKGKTTAALGLALRALCAGKKVYIGQFVKGIRYSEVKAEEYLPDLKIEQLGRSCFIEREPEQEDIDAAKMGLEKCKQILEKGEHDVVILDEINIALYFKLFTVKDVLETLKARDPKVEVVLTGRYAPEEIIEVADLVTEMKEIKHYYYKGVMAREGIEC